MESSLEFSSSLGSSFSSLLSRYRTFKVVVIGDSGVGKTCLTHQLCAGEFPPRVEATIGVDFRERLLDVDGEKIKVRTLFGGVCITSNQPKAHNEASWLCVKTAPNFYAWCDFTALIFKCFETD